MSDTVLDLDTGKSLPNPSMDFAEGNDPSALATVKQFSPRPGSIDLTLTSRGVPVPGHHTVSIIPYLVAGQKVRRRAWPDGDHAYLKDEILHIFNTGGPSGMLKPGEHCMMVSLADLVADDWDIYIAPGEEPTGSDDNTI